MRWVMASRPAAAVSRKGQSGNPRGRSPGAKNLKTLLSEALNEFVIVSENGGRRKNNKRGAIVPPPVNRPGPADFCAIKTLPHMVRDIQNQNQPASFEPPPFTE